MCGFVGLLGRPESPGDALDRLVSANYRLEHRGPDQAGYLWLTDEGPMTREDPRQFPRSPANFEFATGFRRLAIQDLSESGWQPMVSADRRFAVVFNGEVYNFLELRRELEGLWRFRSRSDTEVLLALLAIHGPPALERVVGMFAFAFLDVRERRVLFGRDAFGIKPLYTRRRGGSLWFASEAKALVDPGSEKSTVNPQKLFEYLRFGVTDGDRDTLLDGVQQILPGEVQTYDLSGSLSSSELFTDTQTDALELSFDEAADELRDKFLRSVELHLRSDVPVGSLLSGGIDSSGIACAIREVDAHWKERPLFTFVPNDPSLSEEPYADEVCRATGFESRKLRPGAGDLERSLPHLIYEQDFPFGSTSVFAQREVFAGVSADGFKVVLDGQGADEIFGGYPTYVASRVSSLLLGGEFRAARELLRRAPFSRRFVLARVAGHIAPEPLQRVLRLLGEESLAPAWLNREWFQERGVIFRPLWQRETKHVLTDHLRTAFTRTSLPMLLRWEDRNSMAHSVEARVPFLSPELVSFARALPESYLIGEDGTTKRILRRALRGIVPDTILDRRDKVGFSTPERSWLRELSPQFLRLFADQTERLPVVRWDRASAHLKDVVRGRRNFDFRIWRWINLALWSERFQVEYRN